MLSAGRARRRRPKNWVHVTPAGLALVVAAAVVARAGKPRDVVDPETGQVTRVAREA